jgi:chloramphenicol 3-O phosphotransferase
MSWLATGGGAYPWPVAVQVIVLNGTSSSGKSGLARCLQYLLPGPWLSLGIDTLITAMPVSTDPAKAGIEIRADGQIAIGTAFRELEPAWTAGVAAMARAGARIILDEVFLSGAASQQRWLDALGGLDVLWVAVRCDAAVAAGREIARGDRVPGMALQQADVVHAGVRYDVEVDTTRAEAIDCARLIAARLGGADR